MNGGTRKSVKKLLCTGIIILAIAGCTQQATATPVTTIYEFLPDQSTMVWYFGFGGLHIPHSIEGQFQLSVDFDAGVASFDQVDAILTNGQHPDLNLNGRSLGDLFNMTELVGTVVSDTAIDFEGQFDLGSPVDILVELTFMDNSVHLSGSWEYAWVIPDGNAYSFDAVAVPEPATLFLVGIGGLMLRKRT